MKFGGCTLRENLDPFSQHQYEDIKEALLHAYILDTVLDQPQELDTLVADGGSNFSVGQRQLLCLARAILSRNKILGKHYFCSPDTHSFNWFHFAAKLVDIVSLVLDEPTANIDHYTDELLQESIKENFGGATIIAVAHRLDTVIGYDKILVLGNGEFLEYGSPFELIQKGGDFASMVRDTGDEMSKALISKAKLFATKTQKKTKLICE